MANYQDFSAMFADGNFQEESSSEKQAAISVVKQIVQQKLGFTNGYIFKKVDQVKKVSSKQSNSRLEFDYQDFLPNHRSESSADSPTQPPSENQSSQIQSLCPNENKRKKSKISENDTTKNIIGNITKKSIDIMLTSKRHVTYVRRKLKKLQINYKDFEKYFSQILKTIYGPKSMVKLFQVNTNDPNEIKMKMIFDEVFTKIVRKRYPIYMLKLGKMRASDEYIQIKNKRLLYFSEQVKNVMKTSGV